MFIDEMFEEFLVTKHIPISEAIRKVFEDKLADKKDYTPTTIKQVENGYQLFRKKHPEFPEYVVRRYVKLASSKLAEILNWQ